MTPINHPALDDLHQRTTAMLTTIDDTPLERDHLHYPHHYEELRLLVEDWLTATTATPRRSRSRPGSSPATGPWWVSARPPPPLP